MRNVSQLARSARRGSLGADRGAQVAGRGAHLAPGTVVPGTLAPRYL